jgi:hypothetical protein
VGECLLVDEEFLNEMLESARRAEVFTLVMPEPSLVRPAWCNSQDPREPLIHTDQGIHDYWYQYERLWTACRGTRWPPTITVGGDIHRSYVAHAPTPSLVSVVASPMSPVFGQSLLTVDRRAAAAHPHPQQDRGAPPVRAGHSTASKAPNVGDPTRRSTIMPSSTPLAQ